MSWLLAHIRRRRRRIEETIEVPTEEPAGAESELPECSRPRLALLVHDAAGPTAYRLHTFEDAPSAAAFVQFWFPPRFEHGILAFWTSHQEPAWQADSNGERPAEVVILIRDEARPDIVHPFSCSDIGQAHSRIVMKASRGLDLRLVLLYWAVPVRIETDDRGVVLLTPPEPPMGRDRDGAETGFEAEPALLESEEEVEDTGVVSDLIDFEVEKPVADARLNRLMLEEVHAEPREEAGTVALQPIERDGDQDEVVEAEGKAEVSVEDEEAVERFVQEDAPRVAEDGGAADESACGLEETPSELVNLLRVKRWRRSEKPFKGFGSPEGKF